MKQALSMINGTLIVNCRRCVQRGIADAPFGPFLGTFFLGLNGLGLETVWWNHRVVLSTSFKGLLGKVR